MTMYSLFEQGIAEFNRKEFFQCHETLEEFWRDFNGPEKELIQAIIQVSVAYYHISRGNRIGAAKLFQKALNKATKYRIGRQTFASLDVETLCRDLEINLAKLEQGQNLDNWQYTKISFKK